MISVSLLIRRLEKESAACKREENAWHQGFRQGLLFALATVREMWRERREHLKRHPGNRGDTYA